MAYVGCGRSELSLRTRDGARLLLIGGEPFAEPVRLGDSPWLQKSQPQLAAQTATWARYAHAVSAALGTA